MAEYTTMTKKAADISKITLNLYQIAPCHMPEESILDMKYNCTTVSTDSVSAVSVIHGLPAPPPPNPPQKKIGKLK
jgi:hypothetical protein